MSPPLEPLHIKKYPNRRFYDATRSRHVTLNEVYDAVVAGHDVVVTDSRTEEDITNVILLQIMLERELPKLSVFPSSVLHLMIRSNPQVLRESFERFFGPFLTILAQSQKQFDDYIRQTMRGPLGAPINWANTMMQAFSAARPSSPPPAEEEPEMDEPNDPSGGADDLRRRVAELTRMVEEMRRERQDNSGREPRTKG